MKGIWLLFSVLLFSCNRPDNLNTANETTNFSADSVAQQIVSESTVDSLLSDDYTNYWVVISDSGMNYDSLLIKMNYLSANLNWPIDSMGRFYNRKKNLIALPDDDADEMYAGEYFPRRFESDYLSIEYMNWYTDRSEEKMMGIVVGIVEQESTADSLLLKLKSINTASFKFKSKLYTGCIH